MHDDGSTLKVGKYNIICETKIFVIRLCMIYGSVGHYVETEWLSNKLIVLTLPNTKL